MVTWFQFTRCQSTKDLQREKSHWSEEEANHNKQVTISFMSLAMSTVLNSTDNFTDDSTDNFTYDSTDDSSDDFTDKITDDFTDDST